MTVAPSLTKKALGSSSLFSFLTAVSTADGGNANVIHANVTG